MAKDITNLSPHGKYLRIWRRGERPAPTLAIVSLHVTVPCTHARFAVGWFFKHVLEEKSLSVTSQEKNCLFLLREKINVTFSSWKETNNLIKI